MTLKFYFIFLNSKQELVLIISLSVEGCLRSKQQQLAMFEPSQHVLQHKARPRKPTGVEMAGRSVGWSVAGPSGCVRTCSQQQSGKQTIKSPNVKESVYCSWLANSFTGTAQPL